MTFTESLSFTNHLPPGCFERSSTGQRSRNRPISNGTIMPPSIVEWLTISWIPTKYQGALAGFGGRKASALPDRGASMKNDRAMIKDSVKRPTANSALKSTGEEAILAGSGSSGAARPPSFLIRHRCREVSAIHKTGRTATCSVNERMRVSWPISSPPRRNRLIDGPMTGKYVARLEPTLMAQYDVWSQGRR